MSGETRDLNIFKQYLSELKQNCRSCKNNIPKEDYEKFLTYTKEAKDFLQSLVIDNTTKSDPNEELIAATCHEIILIFTSYIVCNKDESRNDRLKSASLLKDGLLASELKPGYSREAVHVFILLKNVYRSRFENLLDEFRGNNKLTVEEEDFLEMLRLNLYRAENATEGLAISLDFSNKFGNRFPTVKADLVKIVASYSSILDKQNIVTKKFEASPVTPKRRPLPPRPQNKESSLLLSKVGNFGKKLSFSAQKEPVSLAQASRVKGLIAKFNKL